MPALLLLGILYLCAPTLLLTWAVYLTFGSPTAIVLAGMMGWICYENYKARKQQ